MQVPVNYRFYEAEELELQGRGLEEFKNCQFLAGTLLIDNFQTGVRKTFPLFLCFSSFPFVITQSQSFRLSH